MTITTTDAIRAWRANPHLRRDYPTFRDFQVALAKGEIKLVPLDNDQSNEPPPRAA